MENKIINILENTGALLEGHFLLSSGKHSDKYCQCARLLMYPDKAEEVLKVVAEKLKDIEFDLVVGPAMGGIIVAYELGRQLGKLAIFTERVEGAMKLRRGFEIKKGQRIIIAEDVVTTAKSSMEVTEILRQYGGEVVGIACIVDRSVSAAPLPIYSAVKLNIKAYDREACPLCLEGIEYVKPGSRSF